MSIRNIMCHNKYRSGKAIRYKAEEPRHKNAIPYDRAKQKQENNLYKDYK